MRVRRSRITDLAHGLYGALLYVELHVNRWIFSTLLILFLLYEVLQHTEGKDGFSDDILELTIGFTLSASTHLLLTILNILPRP
ncbi:hypothetical protein [Metallosphaera sp.]|uniref:hypothetical protein n=1 Tax=Metallosphaera sp. TaxID=2020860 RepID=UPI00317E0B86